MEVTRAPRINLVSVKLVFCYYTPCILLVVSFSFLRISRKCIFAQTVSDVFLFIVIPRILISIKFTNQHMHSLLNLTKF